MIRFNTKAYLKNLAQAPPGRFDYRKVLESGDWESWRQQFRSSLRERLGMHLIAPAGDLAPRRSETKEFPGYTLEKWYIATEPDIEIPFYLLLPNSGKGPFPLVITPHGHGRRGKETYVGNFETEKERQDALGGDRDIALQAVAEGYAVIAPDVRGFWEMAREEDLDARKANSCAELQRTAMMYGRTLIGERVHDMGRLIDYAQTRDEIDTGRIVITGNSGGGTVSLFTAALDDRICIAVPGSYFCTFADSIVSITHCPCNIVPGILQLGEMYDVAGLIAPRPMLIVHGAQDPIYPIEGTRKAFSHLQTIYRAMGYPDRCELYEGDGGHRYYKNRVWSFVKEHL
jgi:predicted peptidase